MEPFCKYLDIAPEVQRALDEHRPVVAFHMGCPTLKMSKRR